MTTTWLMSPFSAHDKNVATIMFVMSGGLCVALKRSCSCHLPSIRKRDEKDVCAVQVADVPFDYYRGVAFETTHFFLCRKLCATCIFSWTSLLTVMALPFHRQQTHTHRHDVNCLRCAVHGMCTFNFFMRHSKEAATCSQVTDLALKVIADPRFKKAATELVVELGQSEQVRSEGFRNEGVEGSFCTQGWG